MPHRVQRNKKSKTEFSKQNTGFSSLKIISASLKVFRLWQGGNLIEIGCMIYQD